MSITAADRAAHQLAEIDASRRALAHSHSDLPYQNISRASDDFSARIASELRGKEDQLKVSHSLSEREDDPRVRLATDNRISRKANVTASKRYYPQCDFDMKTFTEPQNARPS